MNSNEPLGAPAPFPVISGTVEPVNRSQGDYSLRDGRTLVSEAIDMYMAAYAGRDLSRLTRLRWWLQEIGHLALRDVDQDHVFHALEALAEKKPRYWAGKDADGNPILKAKSKPYSPATINRYAASLGAVFTWCIRKRIVPKDWAHPCRGIERRPENNEVVRFLSTEERVALLSACNSSPWPKLYLLVLMGITTGARKSELMNLRWADINCDREEASIHTTKNGDKKVLPLVPAVMLELRKYQRHSNSLVFGSERRPDKPFNFVPRWQLALKLAKIKNFRFHDLRHSCASYLAQEGATLLEIGEVLGHRQLSVTKRYSHLTTGHKSKLINRVLGAIK
jgi:integrase